MFANMLKFFRWQDLVDIALVAYIIYLTLSLLVGTRAVQLVRGLFLLFILSLVSRWLNLIFMDPFSVFQRTAHRYPHHFSAGTAPHSRGIGARKYVAPQHGPQTG